MDFNNKIKELSEKVQSLKSNISTEEATKTAFILPFLQILGYDIFNPIEVIPEFIADIGSRKREKVDYAILNDGQPVILIECKHWKENLDVHSTQLHRYFHTTKARFGLLTNGLKYRFYTDLEEKNVMDNTPFLEFEIDNIKEHTLNELKKFQKSYFNIDKIIDSASELKYSMSIKEIFIKEINDPSPEFVKFFTKQIYPGKVITKKILDQFTSIVKKSTNQTFKEIINERLQIAISNEEADNVEEIDIENNKIITTDDEIEAYHIVKSIVRTKVDVNRVIMRDKQTYCGILLDDNNRKPICRLHLNGSRKFIGVFDTNKKENKIQINSLDEIYTHSKSIIDSVMIYLN